MNNDWLGIRRAIFPRLRRPEPVGIVRNGGTKRVYECAFCHCQISMSAQFPVTKRVREFCRDHNARCLAQADASAQNECLTEAVRQLAVTEGV